MIFLYIFVAIVAVLALLLSAKVRLSFTYKESGKATVGYLFFRWDAEKLIEKYTSGRKETPGTKPEKQPRKEKKKKKGDVRGFIGFIKHVTGVFIDAAKFVLSHSYVDIKRFHVRIGTPDASETALLYGGAVGAANALFEITDRFTHLKKNADEISMAPDYTSEKTVIDVDITLAITLFSLIRAAVRAYIKFIRK